MPMKMLAAGASALVLAITPGATAAAGGLGLSGLKKVATVDDRFQSYNVEMVEVTGGRFWAPYGGPAGEVYRPRAPLDLKDPRLLGFAKNLAPAYMRVSGTWSNNTYLPAEGENITTPPPGFVQVLSRKQWQDVVDFAKAADAPIVTSFAISKGVRGPDGRWKPDQAQRFVDTTRQMGGSLAAAEFYNEPNMPSVAPESPQNYSADDYAADFRIFHDWARKNAPGMKLLGPGSVGEGGLTDQIPINSIRKPIRSEDMMKATPNSLDAVSYHFYGTVSQRCAAIYPHPAVKDEALTPKWLDRTLGDYRFYAALRDKYEPGKPVWNTETAQAACGGSPWASTFLDSFRYLNQLGALAQQGVQVVMHNTLATSDYALIDRDTMTARPNYWAAVLWRRVMGTVVLASPPSPSPEVRLYAQCLRGSKGGVGLLALNTGKAAHSLELGKPGTAWVMTGQPVDTRTVKVNGTVPQMADSGAISGLEGKAVSGRLEVPAEAIAFVAVPGANNPACR